MTIYSDLQQNQFNMPPKIKDYATRNVNSGQLAHPRAVYIIRTKFSGSGERGWGQDRVRQHN